MAQFYYDKQNNVICNFLTITVNKIGKLCEKIVIV